MDPTAPSTIPPVQRQGKASRPTIEASPGSFDTQRPVKYPDGVVLTVDAIAHGVEQGTGPGLFPGRRHTSVSLSLSNGSKIPIELSQSVVTLIYGQPRRLASPVYQDKESRDFTGIARAGATSSARYLFAVPAGQEKEVAVIVDFDDKHVAATFTGSTR